VSNEGGPCHEDNEVNFNLSLRFDDHEHDVGSYEAFINLGSPQKFELRQAKIVQGFGS